MSAESVGDSEEVSRKLSIIDWGKKPFRQSLLDQHELVVQRIAGQCPDQLILVEHPHVYTYGRASKLDDISSSVKSRAAGRVELVPVERGGSITYHGPGQIVAYPICDVRVLTGDLREFLRALERIVIRTISHWGLQGEHHPEHTGVWIADRKVASVGVAVKRWVSYHGLALNVNTDLTMFTAVRPCGLDPGIMTSMAHELKRAIVREEVKAKLIESFVKEFHYTI